MESTTILYRPVGPKELKLIADTGYRAFPPRLPEQPIFYPVLNEEYATRMPKTRFTVRTVGGRSHQEYFIPAGELADFNENIVGPIEVFAESRSK